MCQWNCKNTSRSPIQQLRHRVYLSRADRNLATLRFRAHCTNGTRVSSRTIHFARYDNKPPPRRNTTAIADGESGDLSHLSRGSSYSAPFPSARVNNSRIWCAVNYKLLGVASLVIFFVGKQRDNFCPRLLYRYLTYFQRPAENLLCLPDRMISIYSIYSTCISVRLFHCPDIAVNLKPNGKETEINGDEKSYRDAKSILNIFRETACTCAVTVSRWLHANLSFGEFAAKKLFNGEIFITSDFVRPTVFNIHGEGTWW